MKKLSMTWEINSVYSLGISVLFTVGAILIGMGISMESTADIVSSQISTMHLIISIYQQELMVANPELMWNIQNENYIFNEFSSTLVKLTESQNDMRDIGKILKIFGAGLVMSGLYIFYMVWKKKSKP